MTALTPKRREALEALRDGDWYFLHRHAPTTLAWLYKAGLMRCNDDEIALRDRLWTITPTGITALERE